MNKIKRFDKRKKDALFVAILITLPLLQYFIFYVCVNFNSFLMAFQSYEMDISNRTGVYMFNHFANFKELYNEFIGEGLIIYCIKNSLIFYCVNFFIGTTASLFFSYYISRKRLFGGLFKVVLFIPSIVSSIVLVTMFRYFADYAIPKLYELIFNKKIPGLLSNRNTVFPTIIFYNIWISFGTSVLLYSGAMSNVSDSVMEASKIDGAGTFKTFIYVIFPLIYPTFKTFVLVGITGLFVSDINMFSFFGIGNEKYLYTFGFYILRGTRLASLSEYPYLAALGVVLTVIALPITFLVRKLLNDLGPKTE